MNSPVQAPTILSGRSAGYNDENNRGCLKSPKDCHSEFSSESHHKDNQILEILNQVQDDSKIDF